MFLKTGCGGFPVSRARYFSALGAVEIQASARLPPRLPAVEGWRLESPAGFEFSLCAARGLTRGHFRMTPEVGLAWDWTLAMARVLEARFIVFETPASFYPEADHLRDMYGFFKSVRRGGPAMVWQPRGAWSERMKSRVCGDLDLILAAGAEALRPGLGAEPGLGGADPKGRGAAADRVITRGSAASQSRSGAAGINYFRLGGPAALGEAQLSELGRLCESRPSYVFFLNLQSWSDARSFQALGERSHVRDLRRL